MNEIQFNKGNSHFILCTRGIAIYRERVLLFNAIGLDHWALPGGRVEMLEPSDKALKREWKEELDTDIGINRLVWVIEGFFKYENRNYHEIGMYYLITLLVNSSLLSSEEHTCKDGLATLRFRWVPLSDIEHIDLRPLFLKKGLLHLPEHTAHIVWNDD
jgi:ADP-ribose pyrophosphatase YjhB (NUDIX family)